MSGPEVEISDGKLKGKVCKTCNGVQFYTFKGIPYAKPPIGDLRFSTPQPPEPWDGVRDATKECNICAQFDKATATFIGDEDCLYLNVYTPLTTNEGKKLPVMVFFHGGGFLFGHGTDDSAHGPDFLIEKEVVIVSLNYRLGILGFLSLDRKEAPGNMGLRDQMLALKWVQKNISQFGGDPKNVTIFGISAGGASVEYLLLSPLTKGLFHKAIAQSGSSLLHWAQNEKVKELAAKIPLLKKKVIKDEDQLLKYLKEMPIKELIQASMLAIGTDNSRGGIHFGFVPTVEKSGDWEQFISKSTYEMLSKGEFAKVPFMSGFCTREGLLVLPLYPSKLDSLVTEKSFISHLPFDYDDTDKHEIETKLKATYLEELVAMWTNFAKYGDPTPKIDDVITTKWEPVGDNEMAYLVVNDKLTMKNKPYPRRTKLYEELYRKFNSFL
ncbi:unnamed protein product [Parnassius apollo]|uniref:Carboxylic ester hydrolase n=1 Tax=Parnassius apollo TaxID=110799 RepID=A0A8S3XIS4_PARAO|nr:unnamed protein product [Parnassius apollo]